MAQYYTIKVTSEVLISTRENKLFKFSPYSNKRACDVEFRQATQNDWEIGIKMLNYFNLYKKKQRKCLYYIYNLHVKFDLEGVYSESPLIVWCKQRSKEKPQKVGTLSEQ